MGHTPREWLALAKDQARREEKAQYPAHRLGVQSQRPQGEHWTIIVEAGHELMSIGPQQRSRKREEQTIDIYYAGRNQAAKSMYTAPRFRLILYHLRQGQLHALWQSYVSPVVQLSPTELVEYSLLTSPQRDLRISKCETWLS